MRQKLFSLVNQYFRLPNKLLSASKRQPYPFTWSVATRLQSRLPTGYTHLGFAVAISALLVELNKNVETVQVDDSLLDFTPEEIKQLKQLYDHYKKWKIINQLDFEKGYVPISVKMTNWFHSTGVINKRIDNSMQKLFTIGIDPPQHDTVRQWIVEYQDSFGSNQYSMQDFKKQIAITKEQQTTKKILLLGEAGAGKSTFCKKLVLELTELNQAKPIFDLVLYCDLTASNDDQEALLTDPTWKAVQDIIRNKQKWEKIKNINTLLIFDNYEDSQFKHEIDNFINELPNDFKKTTIITSSRPYASPAVLYDSSFFIEGFDDNGISQYIDIINTNKLFDKETENHELYNLAKLAQSRKIYHIPYYLQRLCALFLKANNKPQEFLLAAGKFSRTELLDHYLRSSTGQKSVPIIHQIDTLDLNKLTAEKQDYLTQIFLKSSYEASNLIKQYESKNNPSTPTTIDHILQKKHDIRYKDYLLFMAGHLALAHHQNAIPSRSPTLLLEQFNNSETGLKNQDIFGFYENIFLIQCIDEICGTQPGASIHYYSIITRLSDWFDNMLLKENWPMHPLIKAAIANSDFIFKDPIIGDLFVEKLISLKKKKKNQDNNEMIFFMELVRDIGLKHQELHHTILPIMLDREESIMVRCSAMICLLKTLAYPDNEKLTVDLIRQMTDSTESLVIRAVSALSVAILVKNNNVKPEIIKNYLLPHFKNSDLLSRVGTIYIANSFPETDNIEQKIEEIKISKQDLRENLIKNLQEIEKDSKNDTWVRFLAAFSLNHLDNSNQLFKDYLEDNIFLGISQIKAIFCSDSNDWTQLSHKNKLCNLFLKNENIKNIVTWLASQPYKNDTTLDLNNPESFLKNLENLFMSNLAESANRIPQSNLWISKIYAFMKNLFIKNLNLKNKFIEFCRNFENSATKENVSALLEFNPTNDLQEIIFSIASLYILINATTGKKKYSLDKSREYYKEFIKTRLEKINQIINKNLECLSEDHDLSINLLELLKTSQKNIFTKDTAKGIVSYNETFDWLIKYVDNSKKNRNIHSRGLGKDISETLNFIFSQLIHQSLEFKIDFYKMKKNNF